MLKSVPCALNSSMKPNKMTKALGVVPTSRAGAWWMTIRRSNNKKSLRMPSVEERYAWVMRDAREYVFLMAVRRAIDTRLIAVEFDAGRRPGPFEEHSLTISMKETALAVSDHNIPHDWLPVGTGFIDTRFSRVVAALLTDLTAKAQAAGRFL